MFRDLRFIYVDLVVLKFSFFKVFGRVSIERQVMDGPVGLFLQDEYLIVMLSDVLCQT